MAATVHPIRRLTLVSAEVRLELPRPLGAAAGQFVVLEKHLPSGEVRRSAFSIVRTEGLSVILGIKKARSGGISEWLSSLKLPDALYVSGPFGDFSVDHQRDRHILIAGGSGITPIWSIAQALMATGRRPLLIFGNESPQDAMYLSDIQLFADQGQIDFIPFYDRQCTTRIPVDPAAAYLLCGPPGMMVEVGKWFEKVGISTDAIQTESYGFHASQVATEALSGQLIIKGKWGAQKRSMLDLTSGQSLLQCALDAGFPMEYTCGNGVCGTCIWNLESGNVCEGNRKALPGENLKTCISYNQGDEPVILRPAKGVTRNGLSIAAVLVAAISVAFWAFPPGMGFRAAGPLNTGHESLSCQDCHHPAHGSVRQQLGHNARTLLGLHPHDWVPVGYGEVDHDACLNCHDRPYDRHPVSRFRELRFAGKRATLGPQECNNCHGEHHGARVAAVEPGFCVHCHQDLTLDNDPIDVPHEDLVQQENWITCLNCHDFHGNHLRETPVRMADRLHDDQIRAYFDGEADPYGPTKRYQTLTSNP